MYKNKGSLLFLQHRKMNPVNVVYGQDQQWSCPPQINLWSPQGSPPSFEETSHLSNIKMRKLSFLKRLGRFTHMVALAAILDLTWQPKC